MGHPRIVPISCYENLPVTESHVGRSIALVSANKIKAYLLEVPLSRTGKFANIPKRTEVCKIKSKLQTQPQQLWLEGWLNALLLL